MPFMAWGFRRRTIASDVNNPTNPAHVLLWNFKTVANAGNTPYIVFENGETLYVVVLILIFVRIMCATYQRRTVVKGRGT